MADLWTRIDDELRRRRRKWAWLGRAVNATDQAMHNWKTRGIPARQHKPIADALGWSVDQLLDEDWTPEQHSGAGARAQVVAHQVSPMKIEHGPLIDWGVILKQEPLPPLFWTTLPDDSMAPRAPAGKRMCFDVSAPAKPGSGVLVRDSSGAVAFRRYVAGAGGRWSAVPENPAYAPLDSERDGLKVLAVLVAEWGGWA